MKTIIIIMLFMLPFFSSAEDSDIWRQFDKDGSNTLSLSEFNKLRITQYATLDRNSDNHWTKKEFVKRSPDMTMARIDSLRGKFKRWDKDENGRWDTTEATAAIKNNFRWLDRNQDMALSVDEFPNHW